MHDAERAEHLEVRAVADTPRSSLERAPRGAPLGLGTKLVLLLLQVSRCGGGGREGETTGTTGNKERSRLGRSPNYE